MLYEAPEEIRELVRSPFNADSWLIEPIHPAAVQRRYLASRALTFKPGIDVVIPIVELANHGHTTGYNVDETGVGFKGKPTARYWQTTIQTTHWGCLLAGVSLAKTNLLLAALAWEWTRKDPRFA
jgi:hypothetical protein